MADSDQGHVISKITVFFVGAVLYEALGTMAEKMCFACLQQCLPAGGALELNACWECAMS